MKFIKCAPVVLLLAALFAGCSTTSSPVAEVCAREASCGFGAGGQTEDRCRSEGEEFFASLREDAACGDLADKLERELLCASELGCDDLQTLVSVPIGGPEQLPQEFPCRDELIAVSAEMDEDRCDFASSH